MNGRLTPSRTSRGRHRAVACVALIACACATELATPIDPPMVDVRFATATDAVFPSIASPRVTPAAARDTIEFELRDLPPLGLGNLYEIALVDTVSGRAIGVISRSIRTTRSATTVSVDTLVGATFSVFDTATTVAVRIANASIPQYTHVLLRTAGEGSVPTSFAPNARTGFLSLRYRTGAAYDLQTTRFGTWSPSTASRRPFDIGGTAPSAGIWGDWIRLDLRDLTRPPPGFRYSAWLVESRRATTTRLGGLIAPAPSERSLDDADLNEGPWFTATTVSSARVRANLAELGLSVSNYTGVALALEPYGGFGPATRMGRARVMTGTFGR